MNEPAVQPPPPFNFTEFARGIYSDKQRPEIYLKPLQIDEEFLLPALYGGEAGHGEPNGMFNALFVLQEPEPSITNELWKMLRQRSGTCGTPEEAIERHREIFFEWAFKRLTTRDGPKRAELFGIFFVDRPATFKEFFRRVYVTDVWKDAAPKNNRKRGIYRDYWRSKLKTEIEGVATEHLIFVGEDARSNGWEYATAAGKDYDEIVFPSWRNKTFQADVQRLRAKYSG